MSATSNPIVKESYYILKTTTGGGVTTTNITNYLGGILPRELKPSGTIAMEVRKASVAFAFNLLTKNRRKIVSEAPVTMPSRILNALARRTLEFNPQNNEIVLEMRHHGPDTDKKPPRVWHATLDVDSDGVARIIENPTPEDTFETFEHPKEGLEFQLYFYSQPAQRPIAVSFTGYQGKGGDLTSPDRVAAKILFQMLQLGDFLILAGFSAMKVPPPPLRRVSLPFGTRPEEKVAVLLPVALYDTPASPDLPPSFLASGTLGVELDVGIANPGSSRFVLHYTPDSDLAPFFDDFRDYIDSVVMGLISNALSQEEIQNINLSIVLGSITVGTVETLRELFKPLTAGISFTHGAYILANAPTA
jgi:hypothetical protein